MGSAPSSQESVAIPKRPRPITPERYKQLRIQALEQSANVRNVTSAGAEKVSDNIPSRPPDDTIQAPNRPTTSSGTSTGSNETSTGFNETSTGSNETSPAVKLVICYHTKDEPHASLIKSYLASASITTGNLLVAETGSLEYRESAIQWADIVILVVSYKFQQNSNCQEVTNYSKDSKKKVIMIVVQPNYDPTGVVGAVGKAYGEMVWMNKGEAMDVVVNKIKKCSNQLESGPFSERPKENEAYLVFADDTPTFLPGDDNTVYISFADGDSARVAEMVRNGEGVQNYGGTPNSMRNFIVLMGVQTSVDDERIKSCRVFVPIISKLYQSTIILRQQYEIARRLGKNILPVKAEKFTPSGWLALAMAGKLFYEMKNETEAFSRNPKITETSKMNDFIVSVIANLNNVSDESGREVTMKNQLISEIDKIKPQLKIWPPKVYATEMKKETYPDKSDLLPKQDSKIDYRYIPTHVTRTSFVPLYNGLGLPIDLVFDCMLSYQWDIQPLIQRIYEELSLRTVKIWMDMQGGMTGNINDAMARAVEASVSVTVFLTNKYQQSVNCTFEIKYALALGKPLILIVAENNFKPAEWIKELMSKFLTLSITSESDFGKCTVRNYPNIIILSDSLRKLSEWKAKQTKTILYDVSEEVYELENLLENAKMALSEQQGTSRYSICTRCNGQYDESNKSGCKKHRAYYLPSTLMVSQWVCCQQGSKDSLGCEPADHISEKRVFGKSDNRGCYYWTPA